MSTAKHKSYWIDSTPQTNYPTLDKNLETDVVIAGGGITGLTTAYLLTKIGLKVVLIEKKKLAEKTTGNTTAKITSLHSLIYDYLTTTFSLQKAQLYADANQAALKKIQEIVSSLQIDCDLQIKSAFTFAETEKQINSVEKEIEAAKKLNLPAQLNTSHILPIKNYSAIEFKNQAQFHPRKFLLSLAEKLIKMGVQIFENTEGSEIKEEKYLETITSGGTIRSKYIIVATHSPFYLREMFKSKMSRWRDYVVASKIDKPFADGMFITASDNYLSIRFQPLAEGQLVIFDDESHEVPQEEEYPDRYESLAQKIKEKFGIDSVDYTWTAYDWTSNDRIPLIGQVPNAPKNIFVATGFNGWGMTHGVVSAMIFTDLILGNPNPWVTLYNPARLF